MAVIPELDIGRNRLQRLNVEEISRHIIGTEEPPSPVVDLVQGRAGCPACISEVRALPDGSKRPVVRLSDVAKRAGCSAATVSRVLNAPGSVNLDARLRVEAAVVALGYTRNAAARALRSRRSHVVGIILPTLKQPIYADFIEALQYRLARSDYLLIVTTSEYSLEREFSQAKLLAERGIDGLVLIGHTHPSALFAFLEAQALPYVTTYSFRPELGHPVIGFDNFAGMGPVVDHLFGLGHRDFAVLTGISAQNDRIQERVRGAVAALEARDVRLPPERLAEEDLTIEGGRRGLGRLIDAGRRPSALICSSDVLAYGVLIESRARDLVVPRDLSVVGFDDLDASAHVLPALTSLAIPAEEMGRRAGDYLVARMSGREHPDRIELETRLVLRGTTASPPEPPERRFAACLCVAAADAPAAGSTARPLS